ncbi:para-aminobenzoate synthase, aminase component [Geomicrobium sp. JCM 19037]|nr:para-aminobenzoate synthase, aminase component [Geomicrobium sp. JCM 19037]
MTNRGYVQIDFHHKETGPLLFTNPIHIITTNHVDEVDRCLDEIGSWTEQGYFAAGFISYEADIRSFSVHKESGMPLVWFGIFSKAKAVPQSKRPKPYDVGHWETKTTKSKYMKDIETIHEHIRQGDTYQVNYTMQLESQFLGDAKSYYEDLKTKQQAAYSAYVDMGDGRKVVSVSPELFFSKTDNELMTKPMKGTIRRGETSSEDEQLKKTLVHSEKDRAENVMIVDLLRNDLGRIAKLGSVHVNDLFHIEQYPTVWQMTSVVACTMRPKVKFRELVRTLFPCVRSPERQSKRR